MKIFFSNQIFKTQAQNLHSDIKHVKTPVCDSVSFSALKKNQLSTFQFACAEYIKAPLEKFNTREDFDVWSKNLLDKIADIDKYKHESDLVELSNKIILQEWKNFLYSEEFYKKRPALSLIIFSSIVKELNPKNRTYVPILTDEVLYATSREFYDLIKDNPKKKICFAAVYNKNLIKYYSDNKVRAKDSKYWIKIPSKTADTVNYTKNLSKLRALSYKKWCTRGLPEAARHLTHGNFHILFDGYTPVIAIETRDDGTLIEIQDKYNTGQNPRMDYFEDVMDYVRSSEFFSIKEDVYYKFEG